MQTQANFKTLLTATFAFFIFACGNSKKDKEAKEKPADTAKINTPLPAETKEITNQQKCFSNDGLKYTTVVTINYTSASEVSGNVTSQEIGNDKKETSTFTGTISGDRLTVKFVGTPPIIGDASQWTTKPWVIDNKTGKEKLSIVFNAKNYETNKWADTSYEFDLAACK